MIHITCRYLLMLILAAQIRHRLRHRVTKRLECITLLPVAWQWHFGVGDQQQVSICTATGRSERRQGFRDGGVMVSE